MKVAKKNNVELGIKDGVDIMDKKSLKQVFENAKKDKLDVAVILTVPSRKDREIIIVKNGNLEYKLKYYLDNYDDELKLKRCSDIQILRAIEIDFVNY